MTIKAIALVGFYRGDLVKPGDIIDLPAGEFAELASFNKVALAPPPVEKTAPKGK